MIKSTGNPQEKAEYLLQPIGNALQTGFTRSFYKMLDIMKTHGNDSVKALADKIIQSGGLTVCHGNDKILVGLYFRWNCMLCQ